ncbi:MAG: GntR family transcriptional regulator [Coriobacteriaceae bacterium]|nr:GntR family transcriptional regulator [Coriobacteriaceae bacterium]
MISIDTRDSRPLYEQVVDGFRTLIIAGVMARDDKLPSVRSLATQLAINPNTIQRAYRELEAQGYTYSVVGKGSFVAAVDGTADLRKLDLLEQFDQVSSQLLALGCTAEELTARMRGGESR